MLLGLQRVEGGSAVVPFVHMFYSSPSSYLWEDDSGVVRTIQQGEGGEQGDALMPLLFCVGQHAALEEVQARLRPNERLFVYVDDVYVVSKPDWVGAIHTALQESLWAHARIRVHGGKAHVWNQAGQKPDVRGDAEDRRSLQPQGTGVARLRGPFHHARHQSSGDSTWPPRLCGNTSGGDAEET